MKRIIKKPIDQWTSLDLQAFYAHAEEIAGDGDLATINPALHEMAMGIVVRKQEVESCQKNT